MTHNRFSLIGNLTKAPTLQQTSAQKSITNIILAVNRWVGSGVDREERADFFRIKLWDKQAENAVKYLDVGSKVFVEGRMQQSQYERDGQTHYVTELVAEQVEYLNGGRRGGGDSKDEST
jgi:single-strand DNA-binding protein